MALPRIDRSPSPSTSSASLQSTAIMMARASRGSMLFSPVRPVRGPGFARSTPSPGSATKTPFSSAQPWTVMRFSVSVPVLSTQTTVVAPRLSITSQPAHEGLAPQHAMHAEGERRRGHRGQALGHRRHAERDRRASHLEESHAAEQAQAQRDPAQRRGHPDQGSSHLGEVRLQGSRRRGRLGDQRADLPNLRVPAGLGDHGQARPVAHHGSREDHVGAVRQRRAVRMGDPRALRHGHAFAGQQRLVHEQFTAVLEDASHRPALRGRPGAGRCRPEPATPPEGARRAPPAGPMPWERPCAGAR